MFRNLLDIAGAISFASLIIFLIYFGDHFQFFCQHLEGCSNSSAWLEVEWFLNRYQVLITGVLAIYIGFHTLWRNEIAEEKKRKTKLDVIRFKGQEYSIKIISALVRIERRIGKIDDPHISPTLTKSEIDFFPKKVPDVYYDDSLTFDLEEQDRVKILEDRVFLECYQREILALNPQQKDSTDPNVFTVNGRAWQALHNHGDGLIKFRKKWLRVLWNNRKEIQEAFGKLWQGLKENPSLLIFILLMPFYYLFKGLKRMSKKVMGCLFGWIW